MAQEYTREEGAAEHGMGDGRIGSPSIGQRPLGGHYRVGRRGDRHRPHGLRRPLGLADPESVDIQKSCDHGWRLRLQASRHRQS